MRRFLVMIVAAVSVVGLAGCATVIPSYDIPRDEFAAPSVRSIIERIQCELAEIADPDYKNSPLLIGGDFVAVFQLDLTVNDTGGLAPSFSFIPNSVLTVNFGLKYERSREQNFTEKLIFPLRDMQLNLLRARKLGGRPYDCPAVDTNLAGSLGIKQSVEMALLSPGLNIGAALNGTDGAFGGYVNFVVTKNINGLGPTWALKTFKGPGELASFSEVNTDKLTFAFAQGKNVGKADKLLDQINSTNIINALRSLRAF